VVTPPSVHHEKLSPAERHQDDAALVRLEHRVVQVEVRA